MPTVVGHLNQSTVAQMAAHSLGNQFIAGDLSLNPAGSYYRKDTEP